jgi:glycerol kinase
MGRGREESVSDFIMAIDQGTTSSRALLFDRALNLVASAQREFRQIFPQPGWVEHDPEDIWSGVLATCREAIAKGGVAPSRIAAIGIANQRETIVAWNRVTGRPIANAIVWQDRRTAPECAALRQAGHEDAIAGLTGLLIDPYFSATKIRWLLDHVEGARDLARTKQLAVGTIDTFLTWRLTDGKAYVTEATNASRTMLFDIGRGAWSEAMLDLFDIPRGLLPDVLDSAADFAVTDPALFGAPIAIRGIAGDQQAALVGQACFAPGMIKSTYGTSCFALLNTGDEIVRSKHRLLTTIAYQLDGRRTYALEGSIFVAGAAVQWLRDGLRIIDSAPEISAIAERADEAQNVVLVPAFVGLGAPYWDAECRGAIFGLTRATGRAELAKAALESVCFQTQDLLDAMRQDWSGAASTVMRVDGGMAASNWMLQRLADITAAPVDRPRLAETTALGAAYLAGHGLGLLPPPAQFAREWALDRRFAPSMDGALRQNKLAAWKDAVRRTLSR